jgi:hypothetical protein
VIIDTADRAYDMCLDWVCKKLGIPYPGESMDGRNDYGKSWKAVKQEFLSVVHRILRTGRGLAFTSHAVEHTIETRGSVKYTRIFPSMSKQARSVIEALVDMFFYADYVKTPDGVVHRILLTEGDDCVWAGHRECAGVFPRFLPMPDPKEDDETGYEAILRGFNGEHEGVSAEVIAATSQTGEAMQKLINLEKAKATMAKAKAKKGGARRAARKK